MAADIGFLRDLGLESEEIKFFSDLKVNEEKALGYGSGAIVYQCEGLGEPMAAKVLHPFWLDAGRCSEEERVDRMRKFGAEFKRLSALRHPNIAQLYGLAKVHGQPAIVLELLGPTLEICATGEDRLDDAALLGYLADVGSGVNYLHDCGLIHRDLTLQNVLITLSGDRAKITDVNVSRRFRENDRQSISAAEAARAAWMSDCPGTVHYMAPEAFTGKQYSKYDKSMDMFSFGVLALSVLTGHPPDYASIFEPRKERIDGCTWAVTELVRRKKDLDRLAENHPLKPFIHRCLSNDPLKRPSAAEARSVFMKSTQEAHQVSTVIYLFSQISHHACPQRLSDSHKWSTQ